MNITKIFYILLEIEIHIERKLREISGSLVITVPRQVCTLYNFKAGDKISIGPIGIGELRLKKIL